MSENFKFDEFMQTSQPPEVSKETDSTEADELDVQKAVVEDFAAEKLELVAKIETLENKIAEIEQLNQSLHQQIERLKNELQAKADQIAATEPALTTMRQQYEAMEGQLNAALKQFDEDTVRHPNALALIDRDTEMPDRFIGETRDLVLEIIKQARDEAEKANQARRVQLLESVLVFNEPNGMRAKRREEVEKLLQENGYLINATVIERLKQMGLTHKNGATYLTADEILAFNF